jgi:hypothetical protein
MTVPTSSTSALDVLGVFFILLGTGVILDGDWFWRGGLLAAIGAGCLLNGRHARRGAA